MQLTRRETNAGVDWISAFRQQKTKRDDSENDQGNVGQKPPSLPHAKACSNHRNLRGSLTYSTQFLHRKIMSIFIMQYQHNTRIPSLVQHDEQGATVSTMVVPAFSETEPVNEFAPLMVTEAAPSLVNVAGPVITFGPVRV